MEIIFAITFFVTTIFASTLFYISIAIEKMKHMKVTIVMP